MYSPVNVYGTYTTGYSTKILKNNLFRFPFIPLLLYSLYSALGLLWTYVEMYRFYLYRTAIPS
jgi:hypothetical protein